MKFTFAAAAMLLASCAHTDTASAVAAVEAHAQAVDCTPEGADVPIQLSVTHHGFDPLIFSTDGKKGPPYTLSSVYYDVYSNFGQKSAQYSLDFAHGPGGHGFISVEKLDMRHGDTTELITWMYGISQQDAEALFRIQIKDMAGRTFMSNPFQVCK